MMDWKRTRLAAVAVSLIATQHGAWAAMPLRAAVRQAVPRLRAESAIRLDVRLDWDASHLLRGVLRIDVVAGNAVLARYQSGEMALTSGSQTFVHTLPPVVRGAYERNAEARLAFHTEQGNVELGAFPLMFPPIDKRTPVICVCDSLTRSEDDVSIVTSRLALDRFDPNRNSMVDRQVMTTPVRTAPEEMPSDPLLYTCYDMVVATSDGFPLLSEKQLAALSRWVRAGGSLLVAPKANLRQHHLDFLNAFPAGGDPIVRLNHEGMAAGTEAFPLPGMGLLHVDLGRVVVVLPDADVLAGDSAAPWRTATAFLWRLRSPQVAHVLSSGTWSSGMQTIEEDRQGWYQQHSYRLQQAQQQRPRPQTYVPAPGTAQEKLSLMPIPIATGGALIASLMPEEVSVVSTWTVFVILTLFVLMVGPVDYFVLGKLRARRWTWVLFPVTCFAFALFTVGMSRYQMGTRDYRRSLEVVDVGRGGEAVRVNRFDLVLTAYEKTCETEIERAMFAPLERTALGGQYGYYAQQMQVGDGGTPVYAGRLPTHYRVSQHINQWAPQPNRWLSFEPRMSGSALDWDAVDAAFLAQKNNDRAVVQRLSGGQRLNASIFVYHGTERWQIHNQWQRGGSPPWQRRNVNPPLEEFVRDICAYPRLGMFSVVSQVSPTGGRNLEDLAVFDQTGKDCLLVVMTEEDGRIVVYRRVYRAI